MAELKTKPTKASVAAFIRAVADQSVRRDCRELDRLMREVTGHKPVMWGPSLVGYGTYHYVYPTGNTGDWPLTAFSPRKQNLSIHIMAGFERYPDLTARLGKFKTGKSCLYIRRLDDVDRDVLRELIAASVERMRKAWPPK